MADFEKLEKEYDLELEKIVKQIKGLQKKNPKVLLQFPDGLKQYATQIVEKLKENFEEKDKPFFVIWLGTCFGACDIPESDADLLVQFGHAPWSRRENF